jgi:hypothetical protein
MIKISKWKKDNKTLSQQNEEKNKKKLIKETSCHVLSSWKKEANRVTVSSAGEQQRLS